MRGILSNEAGCGTAPAAHSVSSCQIPAKQGAWGIFEVFVDTILLCTLTAIVIIVGFDGVNPNGDFMMMTVNAYTYLLGDFSGYFIAIAVLMFGLATVLCWAHYGIVSVKYLTKRKFATPIFIAIYSIAIFLGAIISSRLIWDGADFSIGAMTLINVAILLKLSGEVKSETEAYFGARKNKNKENIVK